MARALEDLLPERTPLRFLRRLQRIDIIAAHFHLLTRNLVKLSVRQVRVEPPCAAVPEPLTRREVRGGPVRETLAVRPVAVQRRRRVWNGTEKVCWNEMKVSAKTRLIRCHRVGGNAAGLARVGSNAR